MGARGGGRVGGQGGCELRSEAFVKIQKKKQFLGGGRVGWGVELGQGGCEWRSEAFVTIQFFFFFFLGGGWGLGSGGVWLGGLGWMGTEK